MLGAHLPNNQSHPRSACHPLLLVRGQRARIIRIRYLPSKKTSEILTYPMMRAPQTPLQTPAPAHDAEAEGPTAEGIETRTTPKSRRVAYSNQSFQIGLVLAADPNEGRCLITNVPSPVQLCHIVAQATKSPTVRVSGLHIGHIYSPNSICSSRNWSMSGG